MSKNYGFTWKTTTVSTMTKIHGIIEEKPIVLYGKK